MTQFIPVIIALLALFLLKFAWEDLQVLRGGSVTVTATVIEQASRQTAAGRSMSSRGGSSTGFEVTSWSAVYRFAAADGTVHDVTDPVWSTNQRGVPAVGTSARLRYLPGSPERAAPYTFARRFWAYAAVSMFIAALAYAWLNPSMI